jgi:copper transport protein
MKRLRTRWTWVLAAALMGALSVLVGPAQVANAHAALTTTSPTQGSVIPQTPEEIVLTFNEPVALVPGRTQVIAPDGKRINVGDPRTSGPRLVIDVRVPDRPLGTYVVSYRVISADSHAISGAFAFSVGAPSAPPDVQEVGVRPEVRAAVPVAKYLGYVGLTLTVGPLLLLLTLWPRRLARRGVLRLVWTGVGLLAAGTLASLWLQAPYASGAGAFDVSLTELRQVATSQYGVTLLARLALLAAAVLLVRHILRTRKARTAKITLGLVVVGGLVTWPLAGHQIASPAPPIMAAADVVHLASMSVWLGGLAVLVGFLLRRADPRELRIILPVWSRWAAASVYWLVAAGVVQTVVQVDTPAHLLTTDYGRLIVAKVALVAGVLGVAFFSRRMVRRAAGTPVAPLRRAVWAEVAVAAVILAASSVLTQATPARTADVEAAAAAKARGFATTLTSNLYAVQFEVFPAEVGEYNTIHASVYTPDGRPLNVAEWKATLALPSAGIEPIDNQIATLVGNQGLGNLTFPVPGEWLLSLTIRTSEIDQATVTTTIPVR